LPGCQPVLDHVVGYAGGMGLGSGEERVLASSDTGKSGIHSVKYAERV
jgi:hypothetical protein